MPDPDDSSQARRSAALASPRFALLIALLGWPMALGWHALVGLAFGDSWNWPREVGRAIFVWCFMILVVHVIERRKRRAKPPTTT